MMSQMLHGQSLFTGRALRADVSRVGRRVRSCRRCRAQPRDPLRSVPQLSCRVFRRVSASRLKLHRQTGHYGYQVTKKGCMLASIASS